MRVAYLVHFYPPSPCGGAGYYTERLAQHMQQVADTEVRVLCVDHWGKGKSYFNGYTEDIYGNVSVRRLHVNWRKAPRPLDWICHSPILAQHSRLFLEEFQADIVHVSSTYTLSTSPVFVAKEMGLPVVMHLHDYWTICARHTLLHKNGEVCSGPESAWKCQNCLLSGTKIKRAISQLLPETQEERFFKALGTSAWATRLPGLVGMLGDLRQRRELALRATEVADALITPTAFARDVLLSHGVSPASMHVMPYGNDLPWAGKVNRSPDPILRIGFLGNVIRMKGVHLLTEAYRTLQKSGKPVHLEVWGNLTLEPDYVADLQAGSPPGILWGGRYQKEDLPDILSNLDVVVVPSIWYETQGIVIQEAFAAGLPVIVSDNTSMTETVEAEKNGLHFQFGSAENLAQQLRRLLEEPGLLDQLRSGIAPVRSIEQDVKQTRTLYRRLIHEYTERRQSRDRTY